ncbi:MAG: ribosomal protein S18 acetylase RimI-like enzyme [Rhodothermales bacterium]
MIHFRPITMPADRLLLTRIYRSTREDELARTGWNEAEKLSFIRMQFDAQHTHYQAHYPACEYLVILQNGIAIGRLYIDTRPDSLHIIDIAMLCEHRNHGLGSRIMREILTEAERLGRKVGIYVEENNPAMPFYERLGFNKVEHQGIYHHMHWIAPCQASEATPKIWAQARIDN